MEMGFIPEDKMSSYSFISFCSQPYLPPFSLQPLSFFSIFLFILCAESSLPEGCPPQGMYDFWGTKPTDTSYSQRAGLPGIALWVTQDPGSRGWPEALTDVPERSDSI